jgi:hypothetical protein
VPSIGISTVSANYGSAVFCPNRYIEADPPGDTPNEIALSTYVCYYIAGFLWEHYYPGDSYFMYGMPDGSVSPVVPQSYTIILDALESSSDKVTVFSKGHCTPWGYNYQHYQLLCTYPEDGAARDSIHIWPGTDQGKCRFDFIWHCGTARSYPLSPPYTDIDGPIGLPFCFTHNVGMTKYGNSGSFVYTGWNWESPQFEDTIPENGYYVWADLALSIFYNMHYNSYLSLGDTLNGLSWTLYGEGFVDSPLYDDLIVWGNMGMTLNY